MACLCSADYLRLSESFGATFGLSSARHSSMSFISQVKSSQVKSVDMRARTHTAHSTSTVYTESRYYTLGIAQL